MLETKANLRLLNYVMSHIDEYEFRVFIQYLLDVQTAYAVGVGRSRLLIDAFSMRLAHLGKTIHIATESSAPAFKKGDLLVAVSNTGETGMVVEIAKIAKNLGGTVLALTSHYESNLAKVADHSLIIPSVKKRLPKRLQEDYRIFPMGTLFEQASMLFFDLCIYELMQRLQILEVDMQKINMNLFVSYQRDLSDDVLQSFHENIQIEVMDKGPRVANTI